MNIIIPIGGIGERFKKQGYTSQKPLIKIFEKFMIEYVLDNINININDKIFIIYRAELNNYNFVNIINNKYKNINLIELNKNTNGAAETINIGLNYVISNNIDYNNKCLLLDCDTFYLSDILQSIRINPEKNSIFYFNDNNTHKNPPFSYIKLDNENNVIDIAEKIKISNNANTGAYYFNNINDLRKFTKHIIDEDIRHNNEYYISCVIKQMILNNHNFIGIEVLKDKIISLGTPNQVNEYINNTYCFLFDLDGTIINTQKIYIDVWKEILIKYNILLTNELYNNYIEGNNDNISLKQLIPNISDTDIYNISLLKDELFIKNINNISIISGSIDFIKKIYYSGYKLGIVTNCNRIVATKILEYMNISKYLSCIIIGNECSKPKPYPDPYKKALEIINISNNKTIIFEDSKTGLISASGVFPKHIIGVQGTLSSDELKNYKLTKIIQNFNEIDLDLLINNNTNNNIDLIKKYILLSLKNKYDILDIFIDNNKLKGGYISDILKVDIILSNNINLNCILKLENINENSICKMANNLDLYNREYYFYENVSQYIPINIPKFYGIIKDENFKSIGILLENINRDNFYLNLNLNTNHINVSLQVIDNLCKIHSKFWKKELDKKFIYIKKNNIISSTSSWIDYISNNIDIFINKWKNILIQSDIDITYKIFNKFRYIENEILSNEPLTLCHGDVKSPNIFYKYINDNEYDPYFIDWQYITYGKGVQDLVFFMIESFDVSVINQYNKLFREYYYIRLSQYGITDYKYDDFITDFKASICYFPFFVAIWFGTTSIDELIDKNFPFFYIKKFYNFIKINNIEKIL